MKKKDLIKSKDQIVLEAVIKLRNKRVDGLLSRMLIRDYLNSINAFPQPVAGSYIGKILRPWGIRGKRLPIDVPLEYGRRGFVLPNEKINALMVLLSGN